MSKSQSTGALTKLGEKEIIPSRTDVGALANRINIETRTLHNKIDKMMTVKFAIACRDAKLYRQGLQSFYHVFQAIEESLYRQFEKDDEWSKLLKEIWKPEVARKEKAEQDLMFFYNDRKEKFEKPMLSEQIAFQKHIREVTEEKPYLFLAYLHVMYLALFAGGRLMRSSLTKAIGLFPQKDGLKHSDIVKLGCNFFTFDVADEEALRLIYKRDYELETRNNLTEEQKLEIIEESKYIFAQNEKCISEIERHNIERIKQKILYKVATKGQYVLLAILSIITLIYTRRLIRFII